VNGGICPTCSCSLVRLGVDLSSATTEVYEGVEHRFCCEGCAEAFRANPAAYLAEIADWVVCPVCLGEKPRTMTVATEHDGLEVRLCRCPGCLREFQRRPDELLARMAG
jgi:YHS domain-containing protein